MAYFNKPFTPRRPVRTFRDLEIYQKTLECSVLVAKHIAPAVEKQELKGSGVMRRQPRHGGVAERLDDCALAVPLLIAEAHSLRFADFALGVGFLEKAMSAANKMVVYLEHAKGLYGSKLDQSLIEDIVGRYVICRVKMFHLEKSWKRFRSEYADDKEKKGAGGFKY